MKKMYLNKVMWSKNHRIFFKMTTCLQKVNRTLKSKDNNIMIFFQMINKKFKHNNMMISLRMISKRFKFNNMMIFFHIILQKFKCMKIKVKTFFLIPISNHKNKLNKMVIFLRLI